MPKICLLRASLRSLSPRSIWELTNDYVIGRTTSKEFDYPEDNGYEGSRFDADTGIDMNLWHRLLFAIRFADINLLLSTDIQPESQLLWRRNILERDSCWRHS